MPPATVRQRKQKISRVQCIPTCGTAVINLGRRLPGRLLRPTREW